MTNTMWLNLPSQDLKKSKDFFLKIGFTMNERHSAPHMVSMFVGSNQIVVNLFSENIFQGFIGGHAVTNAKQSNEVLFSIGADSASAVDNLAKLAEEAGATIYAKPAYKDGWMYGCGFADLDGHRWNILFMDMSKMKS